MEAAEAVVALADSYHMFAYEYNGQPLKSPAVTKNNTNSQAMAKSLASHNGVTSNALDGNGNITAYSTLSNGAGGASGRMLFTRYNQTVYGTYGSIHRNSLYVLQATLNDCDFTGRAMYQNFQWLP